MFPDKRLFDVKHGNSCRGELNLPFSQSTSPEGRSLSNGHLTSLPGKGLNVVHFIETGYQKTSAFQKPWFLNKYENGEGSRPSRQSFTQYTERPWLPYRHRSHIYATIISLFMSNDWIHKPHLQLDKAWNSPLFSARSANAQHPGLGFLGNRYWGRDLITWDVLKTLNNKNEGNILTTDSRQTKHRHDWNKIRINPALEQPWQLPTETTAQDSTRTHSTNPSTSLWTRDHQTRGTSWIRSYSFSCGNA